VKISQLRLHRFLRPIAAMSIVIGLSGATWAVDDASASATQAPAMPITGQGFMSVQQAAALGIYPNMSTKGFQASVPVVESVLPDSASGCNQLVCIALLGSGLTVTEWSSSATFTIETPAFAIYYKNGVVIATSVIVVAYPGETLGDQMIGSHTFPNNTQLCNGWGGTVGHPWETVHS
jgi:hypothetical protein